MLFRHFRSQRESASVPNWARKFRSWSSAPQALTRAASAAAGYNVYMTRPDNFDQLRAFLSRLLRKLPRRG